MESRIIKSALISVFKKDKLEPIVRKLHELEVKIYSTGGTQAFINSLGVEVQTVESITHFPEILDGRVKTLHPAIFGGILGRRHFENDLSELTRHDLPLIDLVIVDLYPFEETLASPHATHDELIEKIDIGGIALLRASAKNYRDVVVVSSHKQYTELQNILNKGGGETSIEERLRFAVEAFTRCVKYDELIAGYLTKALDASSRATANANANANATATATPGAQVQAQELILRYGENPHQKGVFKGNLNELFTKLSGKELSYNNLVDIDAAIRLMDEFDAGEPTFAILKHTNACGVASRDTLSEAWVEALSADPVSAFGGVLVANGMIDTQTAIAINKLFFEILIAPGFEPAALEILTSKKNRILLQRNPAAALPKTHQKTLLNGSIEQDYDLAMETHAQMRTVTAKAPTAEETADLHFALKIVKHTKSNAIVLARDRKLLGSGVGQTSRVDALWQAIHKALNFKLPLENAVMASDAFFPFPDCVEIAAGAGIRAIVEPGGSVKDHDSIEAANKLGVAMVFTGVRHFKH